MTSAPDKPADPLAPGGITAPAADKLPPQAKVDPVVIESKDLICIRVETPEDADAIAVETAVELAEQTGAVVVVLVGDVRLEALDETEMAAHGWVRAAPPRASAEDLVRVVAPPT